MLYGINIALLFIVLTSANSKCIAGHEFDSVSKRLKGTQG